MRNPNAPFLATIATTLILISSLHSQEPTTSTAPTQPALSNPSSAPAETPAESKPTESEPASTNPAEAPPAAEAPSNTNTIATPTPPRAVPYPPGVSVLVPPQSDMEPDFKIRSDVELVLLDVSVKDREGGFVSGLTREHFKIYENRLPQQIRAFSAQDVPVTVGLVVDNSGSVRPKKAEVVTAALTFVTQSNPLDEVFIVNFNDRVSVGLPDGVDFTGDRIMLREALMTNPAEGRTSLYDAMKVSLEHLQKGRLDKKTLVVIADGGDNMSTTTQEEILRMVETSLATVYTVGIYNPDDKDKNPGFLKEVARISGGEYFEPGELKQLVGVCEKIAKDIRNRYTIGYTPEHVQTAKAGKTRKIRVFANHPSDGRLLRVRTRTEYSIPDADVHTNKSSSNDQRSRAQR